MRAFLPVALLAVTACYSPRSVEPRPGPYDAPAGAWDTRETGPLEASVWYNEFSGVASFDITRPANVALFALRPGASVELIYPTFGTGGRTSFTSGNHYVRTGGSPFRMTGNWSMTQGQGPIYILLVASEGRLDVNQFRATGALNWLSRSSVTYSPYVTLEALVGEIVPNPRSANWTTAMHVVWPQAVGPERDYRPRYMKVQCGSGIIVVVPMEAWWAGYPVCPEQLPPDSVGSDSTGGILERVPFRPQPPQGWMTATVDGVDLRAELERVREENGKREYGRLALTPFARPTDGGLTRGAGFGDRWGDLDRRVTTRSARPTAERSRPAARPAARPATRRPEARPAPEARPKPQARPRPEARPAQRPAPSRPAPPARPAPKPKPKPDGGGTG